MIYDVYSFKQYTFCSLGIQSYGRFHTSLAMYAVTLLEFIRQFCCWFHSSDTAFLENRNIYGVVKKTETVWNGVWVAFNIKKAQWKQTWSGAGKSVVLLANFKYFSSEEGYPTEAPIPSVVIHWQRPCFIYIFPFSLQICLSFSRGISCRM
jgi:hypothetical protein